MKILIWNMRGRACYRWIILVPTPMGPHFLLLPHGRLTWMGSMSCWGRLFKALELCAIEHTPTGDDDCPISDALIVDCGEILEGTDDVVLNFFEDADLYPDWHAVLDDKPEDVMWWTKAVESAKSFGNEHFKKGNYKMALRKYRKSLRYLDVFWAERRDQ